MAILIAIFIALLINTIFDAFIYSATRKQNYRLRAQNEILLECLGYRLHRKPKKETELEEDVDVE